LAVGFWQLTPPDPHAGANITEAAPSPKRGTTISDRTLFAFT
jgi:hypothetical protein